MAPLIFLDIDGVLNTHEWDARAVSSPVHRHKVELLNTILENTSAKIVLSSAWRYLVHRGEMNLTGLGWLLRSHGVLADRLVGITRKDTPDEHPLKNTSGKPLMYCVPNERGRQISDWRTENWHTGPYVVIDDLDLGITDAGHPFVQTNGGIGMTPAKAQEAVVILQSQMSPTVSVD
jgi:hypothetical protein